MNVKVDNSKVGLMRSLAERTDKPNPKESDLAELRKELEAVPNFEETFDNLTQLMTTEILRGFTGKSAFHYEIAARQIDGMKKELGYQLSTFIEKMLIDEVVMRWLRLQVMDNDHKSATYREHSFREGLYYDKRLHLAQKRYLKAIETLTKVRKMLVETQAEGAKMHKRLVSKGQESHL